jgi:hypothetical protein
LPSQNPTHRSLYMTGCVQTTPKIISLIHSKAQCLTRDTGHPLAALRRRRPLQWLDSSIDPPNGLERLLCTKRKRYGDRWSVWVSWLPSLCSARPILVISREVSLRLVLHLRSFQVRWYYCVVNHVGSVYCIDRWHPIPCQQRCFYLNSNLNTYQSSKLRGKYS